MAPGSLRGLDEVRDSVSTLIKYVSGVGSRSNSNHSSKHSLADPAFQFSVSAHGMANDVSDNGKAPSEPSKRNSCDSATLVEKLSNIPLHVRGRAEKWEIPRSQIELLNKLGEGQGGVVYKCRWRALDCAAKLLNHGQSKTSIAYHDMVNEISIISHLRHPNLVLFLGACTVGNEPLVILSEFMAGGSLEDRFAAMAKASKNAQTAPWQPPLRLAIRWITELSRAVCFLHNCTTPIIHRDLKPANLLLTAEDHLKVSDFGLCKTLLKVKEDGSPYQMTGNTGTKRYMAPEVVNSNPLYNEKVDIYSMAMIFWYIFTGVRPFEGIQPDLVAELTALRGMRPPLEGIEWPEMEALIACMWAQNPADRPAAAGILSRLGGLAPPAKLLRRNSAERPDDVVPGGGCAAGCAVM